MNLFILSLATVFTGLMAGLFYAWSISVTPGIGMIDDAHYLNAFQAMNRAILNPLFFIPFMGLNLLLPFLSYQFYKVGTPLQFQMILGATILYLLGVMLVTIAGNVPLNETLEALNIKEMSAQKMEAFRLGFESKWNQLNWIRTACSLISFLLLVLAVLVNNIK